MSDISAQQLNSMHARLEKLLGTIETPTSQKNLLPTLLKELGVATEELQVASEELQDQNERVSQILEAVESQKQFYQSLCDQLPQPWVVTDLRGTIIEANQAAAHLLHIDAESLVGKLLVSFVPIEWRTTFRTELHRIAQLNSNHTWPISLQTAKGKLINLEITTSMTQNLASNQVWIQWLLKKTDTGAQSVIRETDSLKEVASLLELCANLPSQIYHRHESIPLSSQGLWLVQEGLVKLSTLTDDNQEIVLGLVGPSHFLSLGSTFLSTYQATAFTEVHLVQLSLSEVQAYPEVQRQLTQQMKVRMQQLESLLFITGHRRVEKRLYLFLRLLKQEIGQPIDDGIRIGVRLTHEDLASSCCATRVTITRLLGIWQSQGLIRLDEQSNLILGNHF